jgi:short-subunit dehydrogenase
MIEAGEGAILNVASTASFQPLPGMATYAATKAFVRSFSEAVHAELSGTGVSVTVLCPGFTETEFAEVAGAGSFEAKMPGFLVLDAKDVARQAIEGMASGARTVVPGVIHKAHAFSSRFVPNTLLLPIARRLTEDRLAD